MNAQRAKPPRGGLCEVPRATSPGTSPPRRRGLQLLPQTRGAASSPELVALVRLERHLRLGPRQGGHPPPMAVDGVVKGAVEGHAAVSAGLGLRRDWVLREPFCACVRACFWFQGSKSRRRRGLVCLCCERKLAASRPRFQQGPNPPANHPRPPPRSPPPREHHAPHQCSTGNAPGAGASAIAVP
jgi:hypothetical protein